MRRQPDLTFAEALRILDRDEPGLVDKLDKALGFVVLGAGTVAGIAALGTPLAPVVLFASVWGWVDQKNEAIKLLSSLVKPARFKNKRGRERRELIEAAHSLLVASSFLDVLRETIGPKAIKNLAITDIERNYVATGAITAPLQSALDALYLAEIPAPSPARGFQENLATVRSWIGTAAGRTDTFLAGLSAWQGRPTLANPTFIDKVLARYESRYLELAADVPEFLFWSALGEHAATRVAVDRQAEALIRLESLLATTLTAPDPAEDLDALHRANRAILDHPIIAADVETHDVQFPSVERGFITPHYRIARADDRITDQDWWDDQPRHDDLDVMLAAHLTSANATRAPMLVLGHPGAGKSLLTKVIAARLPTANYTVIRVPLRSVEATAPIVHQVQEALDLSTHLRTSWRELARQSADTVRVVLLDGLDELLQAAQIDMRDYLQKAMDFQRLEHDQERPVVVIVTSRTVVADRVSVPADTAVVQLADFDDDQVDAWLSRWHTTNPSLRTLRRQDFSHHRHLAGQPLLLLMLALYAAEPSAQGFDGDLSTAALYEHIFDTFARREARKSSNTTDLDKAVADQLERLSIAAIGMFNRSTQYISEANLSADLAALLQHDNTSGEQVISKFFFIHSAEAVTREKARSYEFLHATFGEFLVARYLAQELTRVARGAEFSRNGPNDDSLHALLSHQLLAARSNIALIIDAILDPSDRDVVQVTLITLLRTYSHRARSRQYDKYRPTPHNIVLEAATYSANLTVLVYEITNRLPPISKVGNDTHWTTTVKLWRTLPDWQNQILHFLQTASGSTGGYFFTEEIEAALSGNISTVELFTSLAAIANAAAQYTSRNSLSTTTPLTESINAFLDAATKVLLPEEQVE
ncbi:NACHT domain-containing protein [Actinokineospora globicatena]|uniref:NACHT domain-containing protein n=1 Tax=Actinokineospora globicatena TaxID=103729 RepID=UPI002557C306|nr:ATP-binding protein [Actinokineospora globicatena]